MAACFCSENSLALLTRYTSYLVTILLAVYLCCCCSHKKLSHQMTLVCAILIAIMVSDLVVKPLLRTLLGQTAEGFTAPVTYNMKTGKDQWGGKKLKVSDQNYWKHDPQNTPLTDPKKIYTNFAASCPLANEYKPASVSGVGVPVDGKDGPKDMFLFAANKASPECCPSTYSTSTGCICTTESQRNFINSRGNNHNLEYANVDGDNSKI